MPAEKMVLSGLKETLDGLKEFDKKAVRKFTAVINKELSALQNEAKALVPTLPPMSGWQTKASANPHKTVENGGKRSVQSRGGEGWPGWNAGVVAAGITKTRAEGRVSGDFTTSAGALKNKSAAGKIFEGAGYSNKSRKSTVTSGKGSGEQFKRTLSNRFGKASRLDWLVAFKHRVDVMNEVSKALEEAKRELRTRLESQKSK